MKIDAAESEWSRYKQRMNFEGFSVASTGERGVEWKTEGDISKFL